METTRQATRKAPPVVATVGMRGSASTWVFNVVRELMIDAVGEPQVFSLFSETASYVPSEAERLDRRYLVVKSHSGGAELDAWLTDAGAPIVLSVRDPRDAAISMMRRFDMSSECTVRLITRDCERLLRLTAMGHPLLRYEDRFFDDPATIARIAGNLGLSPAPSTIEAIFARYHTDAVRAFAAALPTLPPVRLATTSSLRMDLVTQIYTGHIGEASVGEWRRRSPQEQAWLTSLFEPLFDRLGYQRWDDPA